MPARNAATAAPRVPSGPNQTGGSHARTKEILLTLVYFAAASFQGAAGAPPVYLYSFNWKRQPQPWLDLYGTPHVLDVPFAFGTMGRDQLFGCFFSTANKPGRTLLSQVVMDTFGAFARSATGDPANARLSAALGSGNSWKTASGATPTAITSGGTLSVLFPTLSGTPLMLRFDADDTSLLVTAD